MPNVLNPENKIGLRGYVKIAKELYVFGSIVETGISGMAGYYALLEWRTKTGYHTKTAIFHINSLLKTIPKNGKIISA